MSKVSTNLSIDADVKAQAQALFSELGMDLSTAVNIFLRQAVRQDAMPFKITKALPNAITLKAIENAENGIDMHGPFDNVSSLMEALNA